MLVFGDDELVLHLILELRHMGNDADEFGSARHSLQDFHRLAPRVIIQGSESLINEHDVQIDGR